MLEKDESSTPYSNKSTNPNSPNGPHSRSVSLNSISSQSPSSHTHNSSKTLAENPTSPHSRSVSMNFSTSSFSNSIHPALSNSSVTGEKPPLNPKRHSDTVSSQRLNINPSTPSHSSSTSNPFVTPSKGSPKTNFRRLSQNFPFSVSRSTSASATEPEKKVLVVNNLMVKTLSPFFFSFSCNYPNSFHKFLTSITN